MVRVIAAATLLCAAIPALGPRAGAGTAARGQGAGQPARAEDIGSLRNARVAVPMPQEARDDPSKRPVLTYIAGPVPDEELRQWNQAAPNVRVVRARSREEALALAGGAHGVDARFAVPEFLERAPNLAWVQAMSAGVDRYLSNRALMDNDRIVLTNMRAVHGPVIAEHAFAMLLTLTRGMKAHTDHQRAGVWGGRDGAPPAVALHGRTMLVVGLGGIGTEIAARAHAFGMRVIATRRSDTPGPEYVERLGRADDLPAFLAEADVVAVCVPLTPETEGLFDSAAFDAMRPGAYLINIARGRVVNTAALLEALDSGRLAGACLDVTDPEPLPPDHPLWRRENVVITPHVAADGEVTDARRRAVALENMRRFGAGEPLLNVVDKAAGY